MEFNFFDVLVVLSFLLTMAVLVRVYNAVRMVNARVTLLSGLVRELRHGGHAAAPAPEAAPAEGAAPAAAPASAEAAPKNWNELAAADQHLSKQLERDFTAPKPAPKIRGVPAGSRGPIKLPSNH